jgi:hypothetical protein
MIVTPVTTLRTIDARNPDPSWTTAEREIVPRLARSVDASAFLVTMLGTTALGGTICMRPTDVVVAAARPIASSICLTWLTSVWYFQIATTIPFA